MNTDSSGRLTTPDVCTSLRSSARTSDISFDVIGDRGTGAARTGPAMSGPDAEAMP